MCDLEVGQAMTLQVITVMPDTSFRELVGTMIAYGIGAVPVIDLAGRPVGVVAETDLLTKGRPGQGRAYSPAASVNGCRPRWS
jgi:CBS domain-containing protein